MHEYKVARTEEDVKMCKRLVSRIYDVLLYS
jgi:hypothetical protein